MIRLTADCNNVNTLVAEKVPNSTALAEGDVNQGDTSPGHTRPYADQQEQKRQSVNSAGN